MYLEAAENACPHLREQRATETTPVIAAPSPQTRCPFGAGRAPAEPLRLASASSGVGGWWAFAAEARAATAHA